MVRAGQRWARQMPKRRQFLPRSSGSINSLGLRLDSISIPSAPLPRFLNCRFFFSRHPHPIARCRSPLSAPPSCLGFTARPAPAPRRPRSTLLVTWCGWLAPRTRGGLGPGSSKPKSRCLSPARVLAAFFFYHQVSFIYNLQLSKVANLQMIHLGKSVDFQAQELSMNATFDEAQKANKASWIMILLQFSPTIKYLFPCHQFQPIRFTKVLGNYYNFYITEGEIVTWRRGRVCLEVTKQAKQNHSLGPQFCWENKTRIKACLYVLLINLYHYQQLFSIILYTNELFLTAIFILLWFSILSVFGLYFNSSAVGFALSGGYL